MADVRTALRDAIEERCSIDDVLRRFPRSALARLVAGILLFVEDEHEASFAAFERASELNPAAEHTACGLAFERAMRLGRHRFALELAARAERAHTPLVWMRARFFLALALGDDVAELGEAILAIEPNVPEVRVELAKLHLKHDRRDAAARMARDIDPFRSGDSSLASLRVALLRAAGAMDEADEALASARQNFDDVEERELDLRTPPLPPPRAWSADEDRRRALRMLEDGAKRPTARASGSSGASSEEIERFCERGFIRIRGALDPTWRARWLKDAQRRLQEEPERWVKGYAGGLESYAADDPKTWTLPRVDLMGGERVDVASLAPRAWAVMQQLVGSRGVATTQWSNYFIINFGERDEPRYQPPEPGDPHWHVDAPHSLRWGELRSALIGFVLFTDLAPQAGGTFLSVGSHRGIARALSEGADMSDRSVARELSKEGGHFEITGEAGDVFLAHALLVHAQSPNPSGVARFMANPLIESVEPLDPSGDSPVERALKYG